MLLLENTQDANLNRCGNHSVKVVTLHIIDLCARLAYIADASLVDFAMILAEEARLVDIIWP